MVIRAVLLCAPVWQSSGMFYSSVLPFTDPEKRSSSIWFIGVGGMGGITIEVQRGPKATAYSRYHNDNYTEGTPTSAHENLGVGLPRVADYLDSSHQLFQLTCS